MDDGSGAGNGLRYGLTEPAHLGDERTALLGFLQRQRDLLAWKLRDAPDDVLAAVATPTGMTLPGLVSHLTEVERWWLREVFTGEEGSPPDAGDDDPDADWKVPSGTTTAQLLADYAAQCRRADEVIIAAPSLDAVSAQGGFSLRWILLHLVEETARHLGHADVLREQADGSVGEEPSG